MVAAEIALKSPLIPLCQRGKFSVTVLNPSLAKRGRGDFYQNATEIISTNFGHTTLVGRRIPLKTPQS
jgi:hypothetical protein